MAKERYPKYKAAIIRTIHRIRNRESVGGMWTAIPNLTDEQVFGWWTVKTGIKELRKELFTAEIEAMREIKFRGKRLDNGEWLYGNLIELRTLFNPSYASACFIMPKEVNIAAPDSIAEQEVVDPDTVGQFTGLQDKNGKDIYEGDVLFVQEWKNIALAMFEREDREQLSLDDCKGELLQEKQRVVYFEEGVMCAGNYYLSTLWDGKDQRNQYPIFDVEIIGNIHDNPELLNQ